MSPLHFAARKNRTEIIKLLLQQPNIELDTLLVDGKTSPLMMAIQHHALESVVLLTEAGCSFIDGKYKKQYLPLNPHPIVYSVVVEDIPILEYFLGNDRALENFSKLNMDSALEYAQSNNIEILRILCKFLNVSEHTKYFPKTPIEQYIIQAIRRHYSIDVLDCYFSLGIVPYSFQNERDQLSLLHTAVLSKNLNAARYLIEHNADSSNLKNDSGDTPLSLAIRKNNVEMAELLAMAPDLDVNVKIKKKSLLQLAESKQLMTVVKLLSDKGI